MRIVIFGCGIVYKRFKRDVVKNIKFKDEIVCFIDNRADIIKSIDNRNVYLPSKIKEINYDYVITMSYHSNEMKKQLLNLGVENKFILSFETYRAIYLFDRRKYIIATVSKMYKKSVLIFALNINYDGGSIAIVNAAVTLSKSGYKVTITAPYIRPEMLTYIFRNKVNALIIPECRYCSIDYILRLDHFDVAIVNVFPNIRLACEISDYLPTLWWIHESGDKYTNFYKNTVSRFSEYATKDKMRKIHIVAVSNMAKKFFNLYFANRIDGLMMLGINDFYKNEKRIGENEINFAIIGNICKRKGQDLVIKAVELLPYVVRKNIRILFIGAMQPKNTYTSMIEKKIKSTSEIEVMGVMTREEIRNIMNEIDVIVCPSREETLSIAVIEGLMNKKICITTDKTGIADYIKDGENGFIVKSDSPKELAKIISKVVLNYNNMYNIKINARKTYEQYFSLDKLNDALEKEICLTIQQYHECN